MITDCPTVEQALSRHYGATVAVRNKTSVSGGCINQAWKLVLSNGERIFLKENSARYHNMFLAEALGLQALDVPGGPAVPQPIAVYQGDSTQFIAMTFIDQGQRRADFWEAFGRTFAALHLDHRQQMFGFESDNYIGSTEQSNRQTTDWISFFGDRRLGFQLQLAQERRLASPALVRKTEALIARLADFLPSGARPSVLHGDLWSGNLIAGADGRAVMIDPAVYYGHNEADLAMTELFGRFDSRFYAAYSELIPLGPEYEIRKEIYGLYHILNHLNLFGPSYESQALSMLNRLV